jgi:hypothetical protein
LERKSSAGYGDTRKIMNRGAWKRNIEPYKEDEETAIAPTRWSLVFLCFPAYFLMAMPVQLIFSQFLYSLKCSSSCLVSRGCDPKKNQSDLTFLILQLNPVMGRKRMNFDRRKFVKAQSRSWGDGLGL